MDLTPDNAVPVALKTVRLLRAQVCDIFRTLANGVPNDGHIYPTLQSGPGGSLPGPGAGTPVSEQPPSNIQDSDQAETLKNWLTNFTQATNQINTRVRDLESLCALIGSGPSLPVNVGTSSHLALDSNQDRNGLYTELLKSHRWHDKLYDYSRMCEAHLKAQFPKRSLGPNLHNKRMPHVKMRLMVSGYSAPPQSVDNILTQISRAYAQDMKVEIYRPYGSASIVVVTLSRVLRAFLIMRGFIIEHVIIRGLHEQVYTDEASNQVIFSFYLKYSSNLIKNYFEIDWTWWLTIRAH